MMSTDEAPRPAKKRSLRRWLKSSFKAPQKQRSFSRLFGSQSSLSSKRETSFTRDGNRKEKRASIYEDEAYIQLLASDSFTPETPSRRRRDQLTKARSCGNLMASSTDGRRFSRRGTDASLNSIASSASMMRHHRLRQSRSSILSHHQLQRESVSPALQFGGSSGSIGSSINDAIMAVQVEDLEKENPPLRLGSSVPDFGCDTTHGYWESFLGWKGDHWTILCSHPADFTPVCTTEIVELAEKYDKFKAMDCKVAILSADPLNHHSEWSEDILALCRKADSIPFPIIADPWREIASEYGMVDLFSDDPTKMPTTIRSVFFISPENKLALSLSYPNSVGRSIDEIIRCMDALQLSAKKSIATPAGWPSNDIKFPVEEGDDDFAGCVFLSPSLSKAEADAKYPSYQVCPLPSGKQYIRLVKAEHISSESKTKSAAAEDKSREVKKWPGHLRVIRGRVFVSDLPQEAATAEWKFGKDQPKLVMEAFNWYLTLRDMKVLEVGVVIGGAALTQKKYLSSLIGLAVVIVIGLVVLWLITSRKKRANLFNGLFVHFFMEISFDDGSCCVLERTTAGLFLRAGKVKRDGMTQTLVWEANTVDEHVRLAQIRFFCQRHRNDDYDPVFSNGKHMIFNFLTKVLQDRQYPSYDEFHSAMVKTYAQSTIIGRRRSTMAMVRGSIGYGNGP